MRMQDNLERMGQKTLLKNPV